MRYLEDWIALGFATMLVVVGCCGVAAYKQETTFRKECESKGGQSLHPRHEQMICIKADNLIEVPLR